MPEKKWKKFQARKLFLTGKKFPIFLFCKKSALYIFFKITVHFPFLKTNGKICEKIRVAMVISDKIIKVNWFGIFCNHWSLHVYNNEHNITWPNRDITFLLECWNILMIRESSKQKMFFNTRREISYFLHSHLW